MIWFFHPLGLRKRDFRHFGMATKHDGHVDGFWSLRIPTLVIFEQIKRCKEVAHGCSIFQRQTSMSIMFPKCSHLCWNDLKNPRKPCCRKGKACEIGWGQKPFCKRRSSGLTIAGHEFLWHCTYLGRQLGSKQNGTLMVFLWQYQGNPLWPQQMTDFSVYFKKEWFCEFLGCEWGELCML